jgi:hypothetical protein
MWPAGLQLDHAGIGNMMGRPEQDMALVQNLKFSRNINNNIYKKDYNNVTTIAIILGNMNSSTKQRA